MLYYHTHPCHFHPSPGFVAEPPSGRLPLHLCRAVCDDVAEATGRQRRCGAPRRLGAVRCPCSRSGGGELVYAGHEDHTGVHMDTPWYTMIHPTKHADIHPCPCTFYFRRSIPGMIIEYHRIRLGWILGWRAAQATADWLLQCQNLDGGFGCRPRECESHVPWAHVMPRHQESPGRNL